MSQSKQLLVIDGNNVIRHVLDKNRIGSLDNLTKLINSCKDKGYDILPMVSARMKYSIDNPKLLEDLINQGVIIETPAGVDSDLFILETTKSFRGAVVSNDLFRNYRTSYPYVWKRRIPFLIIRNKVIIPSLGIA